MKKKRLKLELARKFRRNQTESERIMWRALRNRRFLNQKFRHQHLHQGYVLDFYCPDLKLAVEIDGPIHLGKKPNDRVRQRVLHESEIRMYRVASDEVEKDIVKVLERIRQYIESLTPDPSPTRTSRERGT